MERIAFSVLLLLVPVTAQVAVPEAIDPAAPIADAFAKEPIPFVTVVARRVAIADVDGDGLGDVLVGGVLSSAATAPGFRYFHNEGGGAFVDATWSRGPGFNSVLTDFAVADIDGDGDPDLLGTASLVRNTGGRLTSEPLPASTVNRKVVAAGDVDGDGDVDLFVGVGFGGGSSMQDLLLLNDGTGVFSFTSPNSLPVDNDEPRCARLFDADGDGDLDLLVGLQRQGVSGGGARFLRNNGAGVFVDASASLPAPQVDVRSMITADFDGDGDQDVVFGTGADNLGVEPPDLFFRNNGLGQFSADVSALPNVLASTLDLATEDLDGDGDQDLLLADGGSRERLQRVYRNDGLLFTDVTNSWLAPVLLKGAFCAIGNLNGDSHPDAVVVSGTDTGAVGGTIEVFVNQGGSSLLCLSPDRLSGSARTAAITGVHVDDVDRDGDLDLFFAGGSSSSGFAFPQFLMQNDGNGRFADISALALPGPLNVRDARFGDVDGDGDRDLVLGTDAGAVLWLNDGQGGFQAAPAGAMPVSFLAARTIAVGDVDNDGDLDIHVGRYFSSAQDQLLRNNGSGVFALDPAALPSRGTSGVKQSFLIDYDGDGDLDLVLLLGTTGSGYLLAHDNDGQGHFAVNNAVFPAALGSVYEIYLLDADDDGDSDFVAEVNLGTVLLLQQAGAFLDVQIGAANARDPVVVDIEGDGDDDVILDTGGDKVVWRNEGGQFSRLRGLATASRAVYLVGAELDGDGDADFVQLPLTSEPPIILGRDVQLHAPLVARVGQPYPLHLQYLRDTRGVLLAGLFVINSNALSVPMQVPPFGGLRVDPVGATMAFGVVPTGFDADDPVGLRLSWVLPNVPALVGQTLYSQALLLAADRSGISNRIDDLVH